MSKSARYGALLVVTVITACAPARAGLDVRYLGSVRSQDRELGHRRYVAICGPCHEEHNDRRAPMLSSVHLPAPAIRRQVREGDVFMTGIPVRRLSDADLEAVLAFLTATGTCLRDTERATPASTLPSPTPPSGP